MIISLHFAEYYEERLVHEQPTYWYTEWLVKPTETKKLLADYSLTDRIKLIADWLNDPWLTDWLTDRTDL